MTASLRRSLAMIRLSARQLLADPANLVTMTAFPLILAPFMIPGAQAQLKLAGLGDVPAANQVIPGVAIFGAFLSCQTIVMLFYKEHAWGTWDRLRATPLSTPMLLVGKIVPSFVALLVQTIVVIGLSALLYGFRPLGSACDLGLVVAAFTVFLVSFALATISLCRTVDQALTITALGGIVLACLGGALGDISGLPDWVQAVAHASPGYWAIDAVDRIAVDGAGLGEVLPALAGLLAVAAALAGVTVLTFRAGDAKAGLT